MGKVIKGSAAFLLSFVMLLTLSAGFGRPAAAVESLNDAYVQNVSACKVKVENKGAYVARFSVSYENSDGTWVSVMNKETFVVARSKTVDIPQDAKNVRIIGEDWNLHWLNVFDEKFSNEYSSVHAKLTGISTNPHYTLNFSK